MTTTKFYAVLVCSRCKGDPELLEAGQVVHCSRCDISGDKEQAIEAAKQYFGRCYGHEAMRDFQKSLADSFRGEKNISYTPGKIPTPTAPAFIFKQEDVSTSGDLDPKR